MRRLGGSSRQPRPSDSAESIRAQLADGALLDQLVNEKAGLDDLGLHFLDEEIGPYPTSYESSATSMTESRTFGYVRSATSSTNSSKNAVGRAIANLTFVADRRVEVIAHGLEIHPESILRVVEERELHAPGEQEEQAERVLSYLFGVAAGRWDARIGADPSLAVMPEDLMAPPAPYSPGMLLGDEGIPVTSTPDGYGVEVPPDGLLLDQETIRGTPALVSAPPPSRRRQSGEVDESLVAADEQAGPRQVPPDELLQEPPVAVLDEPPQGPDLLAAPGPVEDLGRLVVHAPTLPGDVVRSRA